MLATGIMLSNTYRWRTGKTEDYEAKYVYIPVASLGRVASYRFLVITGPREGGRAQLIQALEAEANTQVLDLDTMARTEEAEVSQEMFESRIMHTLIWKFSPDKVNHDLSLNIFISN